MSDTKSLTLLDSLMYEARSGSQQSLKAGCKPLGHKHRRLLYGSMAMDTHYPPHRVPLAHILRPCKNDKYPRNVPLQKLNEGI